MVTRSPEIIILVVNFEAKSTSLSLHVFVVNFEFIHSRENQHFSVFEVKSTSLILWILMKSTFLQSQVEVKSTFHW